MGRKLQIEITPGACICWALMLLVLPLRWVVGAAMAALFHEAGHCAAILLCGGKIHGIRIGVGGASMEISLQAPWKELLCAAAGPVCSFSLLLAARYIPVTALCGLVQGMYNLLPLFPMDGGRILRRGLELLLGCCTPETIGRAEKGIQLLVLLAGICLAVRLGLRLMIFLFLPVVICRLLPMKNTLQRS